MNERSIDMNRLEGRRITIKDNIYDELGRIYIAKGRTIILDSVHIKKFKDLGIWEQVLAAIEGKNQYNHSQKFQTEIDRMNKKYHPVGQIDFNSTVEEVQKIVFEERIFNKYPYVATLTEHMGWYYTHSINVAILSVLLAKKLGYDETTIREIVIGAILHDIGVIFIDKELLEKGEMELTKEEKELRKKHSTISAMIVKHIDIPAKSKKIIEQHHETLDGTGYPNQLQGEEIIEEAQIVGIANTLDRGTSYRRNSPIKEIKEMVEEMYNLPEKYNRTYIEALKEIVGV